MLGLYFRLSLALMLIYHCGPQQSTSVYKREVSDPTVKNVTKDSQVLPNSPATIPEPEARSADAEVNETPIAEINETTEAIEEQPITPPEIVPEQPARLCPTPLPAPKKVSDLLGINLDLHKADGSPEPSVLKNLGIKWIRVEFKPFQKDFDKTIAAYLTKDTTTTITPLKKYKDAGLKIVLIVDYMLYEKGYWPDMSNDTWNEYFSQYKKNLTKVTANLAPLVDVWQIWNEEDHRVPGYEPYMDPSRYALVLSTFHDIIRPSTCAPIILGGLASGDMGTYLSKTIEAHKKIKNDFPFEAISLHPYGRGVDGLFENFGNLEDFVNAYQSNALTSNNLGDSVKIVITEAGLNASQDTNYKEYVVGMYKKSFELGIPFLTWFAWHDNMVDGWGMIRKDGSHRPSYEAFLELKNL